MKNKYRILKVWAKNEWMYDVQVYKFFFWRVANRMCWFKTEQEAIDFINLHKKRMVIYEE